MTINELAWSLLADVELYLNKDDNTRFPWITFKHYSETRRKRYV